MSDGTLNNPSPQFGTAEYAGPAGNDHCQFCHQPVTGTYYRINQALACPGCAEKARFELSKDTHAAYVRGLLFGIGAAVVGMILYATFTIMTGLIVGYVSLAVGWMVGTAMMKGSGGIGGRRYQITAALLTYAAVSMAAVPIWIHYAREHKQTQERRTPSEQRQQQQDAENSSGDANPTPGASSTSNPGYAAPRPSASAVWLKLAALGIASPILEVWQSGLSVSWGIGIVILIVGIRIAWRITAGRPLQLYGPFENSQPAR
jgi:hypothetical protein